jgi:hypothetical protein
MAFGTEEGVVPVYNVTVLSKKENRKIKSASAVPQRVPADCDQHENCLRIHVAETNGHGMIAVSSIEEGHYHDQACRTLETQTGDDQGGFQEKVAY